MGSTNARAKITLRDRVTRSRLPVTGSFDPRENAPMWAAGIIAAVMSATTELPMWARVVVVVVALAAGAAAQWHTVAVRSLRDSGGTPTRDADGQLGQ